MGKKETVEEIKGHFSASTTHLTRSAVHMRLLCFTALRKRTTFKERKATFKVRKATFKERKATFKARKANI